MSAIGRQQRGFTLVEVLVALAIMVILFALLFAPMIAGIEWVTSGRVNVRMQDACRYAVEQIKRELGEAVYVHGMPGHVFPGPNGSLYDYDDIRVTNYSQIVFHPPARDSFGNVVNPPRPAVVNVSGQGTFQKVVRYGIHLIDPSAEYGEGNPFALYREEFLWAPGQSYPMGSFDASGNWMEGVPLVENVLTPRRSATFIPTTTVFVDDSSGNPLNAPDYVSGYVPYSVESSRRRMYLFRGLQFEPHRETGDALDTDNGVVYRGKYAAWDGTAPGTLPGDFLGPEALGRSELDPHFKLYSWDPDADTYGQLRTDSYNTAAAGRPVSLRWSPDAGAVTCGEQVKSTVVVEAPGTGGDGWYGINSVPSGVTAIYPADTGTISADDDIAPTAYRIDPTVHYGSHALIQRGTLRVQIMANGRQIDLQPTDNFDQRTISGNQYCVHLQRHDDNGDGTPDSTTALIRLSRFDPPRPNSRALGLAGNPPDNFKIHFSYYFRRNYTYDPQKDQSGDYPFVADLVKADYSVRSIQDIRLTLTRYVDLVDAGGGVLVKPQDVNPNKVTMSERVVITNFGR